MVFSESYLLTWSYTMSSSISEIARFFKHKLSSAEGDTVQAYTGYVLGESLRGRPIFIHLYSGLLPKCPTFISPSTVPDSMHDSWTADLRL